MRAGHAEIVTPRLRLRRAEPGDLDDLHEVFSDASAMRYWSHPAHESRARTAQTLEQMIASHDETGLEFVLEHAGRVVGNAGLWRLAEIGYILHPNFWRRGLMREALGAILPAAWARHPTLDAITAEIDPRNRASERLLAGLGFDETHRAERTLAVAGEWCDSSYWRLARPDVANPPQG